MTADPQDSKAMRDFAHTVSVLIASALAEQEIGQVARAQPSTGRRFIFQALAAATQADQDILPSGSLAQGGELSASIEARADELWLHLQVKGYAALKECAGREAHLVSRNGAIDYRFRFGERGSAVCVLADTLDIREGLGDYSVSILSE